MIKPVSLTTSVSRQRNINFAQQNPINTATKPLGYDTISFQGKKEDRTKINEMRNSSKISAAQALDRSMEIAREYGSKEVREEHCLLACLEVIDQYIEDLDSGETYYGAQKSSDASYFLEVNFDNEMFKIKEKRDKIKPIIKEEIETLKEKMSTEGDRKRIKGSVKFESDNLNTMYALWNAALTNYGEDSPFSDTYILHAALFSDDDKFLKDVAVPFRRRLQEALMLDDTKLEDKAHLKFYDDKARNIWKNLAVGTNMFILHDERVNPQYLVNSFEHLLNEGEKFGKLDADSVEIIPFNKNVSPDFISHKIRRLLKDEKTHVFIVPTEVNQLNFSPDMEENFKKPPKGVKFVLVSDKNQYYSVVDPQDDENPFSDYGEVSVPILNTEQAKKVFRDEKSLTEKISRPFEPEAIDKCVEVSAVLPGNYPEKTQKVMNLIASYYIDKDIITADDVMAYVEEAEEVFKPVEDDSSVIVTFDTGKKLDDMIGAKGTKEETKSIIRQIKDKTIGTKGYIIYSQDGYPGAGRRHTAQVIAGEAKIPYVEINALDFGTKDVDIFGGGGLTPEASMKKLFGLVKSQAETNESKSAVLFIENFEYFSVGEQVSEYHQKAMSQLLREMTKAEKQGLNIVIMGSMSDPRLIGESTLKSFKFIDEIEVESPSRNTEARRELLEYYIDKKGIQIDGETKEEIDKVIQSAAETTAYFPLVELLAFLDKAQNVSKERGKDKIQKEDFIEAYLQITTGRPSFRTMPEISREITSAHECGHAINMQIMDNILNESGLAKPWAKASRVDFISLDPRSDYLGAVYPKGVAGDEYTLFDIMANMAVCFGGNSAEHLLYGFDGSWGITQDMAQMTQTAEQAIQYMGLGPNVGKLSIANLPLGGKEMSPMMQEKFDKDLEVFTKNAGVISDKIVFAYSTFVKEFAEKYKNKVGTGDCIITSEEFKKELDDWMERQTPEKRQELENLNKEILQDIETTRQGKFIENENK